MTPGDWRAVIDEYSFSGQVSQTQLMLAAAHSDHVDVAQDEATDYIPVAVDAGVLEVASSRTSDPKRALSFRVGR
ncbi:hypothetical protein [Haloarcula salina]|uniref:Uncharacterized protein n=1 Tax=Haloarcula salina TaxID=1429914 RepID=A0AA41G5E2_9EURY|nr:hypothetical protein [Haloarcula salina]MBV0903931.1 hypothetical protein [Haloarcula salina]